MSPVQELSISHSILSLIPCNLAIEFLTLPYAIDSKGRLETMMVSPDNTDLLQKLQLYTGKLIKPKKIDRDSLLKLISQHYEPVSERNQIEQKESEKRFSINLTASAITIVNDIIHDAVRLRASEHSSGAIRPGDGSPVPHRWSFTGDYHHSKRPDF